MRQCFQYIHQNYCPCRQMYLYLSFLVIFCTYVWLISSLFCILNIIYNLTLFLFHFLRDFRLLFLIFLSLQSSSSFFILDFLFMTFVSLRVTHSNTNILFFIYEIWSIFFLLRIYNNKSSILPWTPMPIYIYVCFPAKWQPCLFCLKKEF